MKSLIIGSQGLVGSALKKCIPNAIEGIQMEAKTKEQVYIDITKYETLFKVFSERRPDVVYLPAAITNVDKCEDVSTNVVNIRGTTTVLRLCEQFESKFIWFSTSYVFDGYSKVPYSVDAETNPLGNYGKQKEAMERLIANSDTNFVIIRTVGVFGEERMKKNFAKSIISAVFAGREVFVPNDQYMNPILSLDLAKISVKLAEKEKGLFHVAGDTCISKYDFAVKIAKYFNLDKLIIPTTSDSMKQRAIRPKMGCLDCSALPKLSLEIPSLERGLLKFLTLEYNG